MSEFRELLIGCGHSRMKKLASLDGCPDWRGLTALDVNPDCDPDVVLNLDGPLWRCGVWMREPNRGTEYHFVPDMFDEIHAYEVLEHLGQQGDARAFFAHFSEIWRILKPGGILYATVPSRFSPWLWGDPSHRRAILPESLVFLDQSEYTKQLDCPAERRTAMSDFRSLYKADFRLRRQHDNRETFAFALEAVKPSRIKA